MLLLLGKSRLCTLNDRLVILYIVQNASLSFTLRPKSSMGGTDKNNFLNTIGKNKNGSGNGDILIWKRKAEKYLVEVSTLSNDLLFLFCHFEK